MSDHVAKSAQIKVGAVLKGLRRQRTWTLSEVGRRAGLGVSSLSKIEKGHKPLTLDNIVRLSQAFEVEIAVLFGKYGSPSEKHIDVTGRRSISRAGHGESLETKNWCHLFLTPDIRNKRVVPILSASLEHNTQLSCDWIQPPGEEFAFVIEGEVFLSTGAHRPIRLVAGDSVFLDCNMGRAFIPGDSTACRILHIFSASNSEVVQAIDRRHEKLGCVAELANAAPK